MLFCYIKYTIQKPKISFFDKKISIKCRFNGSVNESFFLFFPHFLKKTGNNCRAFLL